MMQIPKFLRPYQGLIISILMIIVAILGIVFGIIPAIGKIIQMRSNIISLSEANEQMKTKLNILESTDENVYRSELQDLVAAVPSDKSLTTLFSTVDAISASSGVTISDLSLIKPGSIATESAVKQSTEEKQIGSSILPFTVTVYGTYAQIHDFLSQVVGVRRFFRVRNFDISFSDVSNISVRMGMDAFYSPISLNPATFNKPLEPLTQEEEQIIAKIQALPIVGQISLPAPSTAGTAPEGSRLDIFTP